MSLLNNLFGNASEVNADELKSEFGAILIPDEDIVAAFRIFRDYDYFFVLNRDIHLHHKKYPTFTANAGIF